MTIHLVDESDTGLCVFVRTRDNPVPNVRREDHARKRRLFDRAVGKIGGQKRLSIAERYCRSIWSAINDVVVVAYRIVNPFIPGRAIKLELKPFILIDGVQEVISDVDGDIEVG